MKRRREFKPTHLIRANGREELLKQLLETACRSSLEPSSNKKELVALCARLGNLDPNRVEKIIETVFHLEENPNEGVWIKANGCKAEEPCPTTGYVVTTLNGMNMYWFSTLDQARKYSATLAEWRNPSIYTAKEIGEKWGDQFPDPEDGWTRFSPEVRAEL